MGAGVLVFVAGCGVVKAGALNGSNGGGDVADGGSGFEFGGGGEDGGSAELDATVSCLPTSVITLTHQGYRSADSPSDACLGADGGGTWEAYFDACLGPHRTTDACADYKAANPACTACIVTSYSAASSYGPILDYGEYVGGNVAGCLELTMPGNASCAKTVQALTDCELAACAANCPVVDSASLSAREQCESEADMGVCNSVFTTAADCKAMEADAGVPTLCLAGPFEDFYDAVVPLFCGRTSGDLGGLVDSGTDVVPPGDGGRDAGALVEDAGDRATRDE